MLRIRVYAHRKLFFFLFIVDKKGDSKPDSDIDIDIDLAREVQMDYLQTDEHPRYAFAVCMVSHQQRKHAAMDNLSSLTPLIGEDGKKHGMARNQMISI